MDTNFLQKLNPLIEELADKYGFSREQAQDIVRYYFEFLKESIQDPRIPRVKTPIGSFFLTKTQSSSIKARNLELKDKIDPDLYTLRMEFLDQILGRMTKERSGGKTYWPWKRKEKREEITNLFNKLEESEKKSKQQKKTDYFRKKKNQVPIHGSQGNPKKS